MKTDPPDFFGSRRVLKHGKGYAAEPGSGPPGQTCGTCAFISMGRRFKKCGIGTITSGEATDILVSAPACRLWTKVGTRLCERCVHYCPWNGQGMGCSAPGISRLLGAEPPPCRGKLFAEAQPVSLEELRRGSSET